MRHVTGLTIIVAWLAGPALADIVLPGSNHGTDGVFAPTASIQIDLGKAQSGPGIIWESPGGDMDGDGIGDGVYDRTKWAVVFKFSSVNIPSGVTVTFKNHPSRAPVVWLVDGSVTIDGTIDLHGEYGAGVTAPEPGPGGFRGAFPRLGVNPGSAGFGFGGGRFHNSAGSFGTRGQGNSGPTYGNAALVPLVGGSGGAVTQTDSVGCYWWAGGGSGGGAILIAAKTTIHLGGTVKANGGEASGSCGDTGSGGSGGGIRLIADTLAGAGHLRAVGGVSTQQVGGYGRIRVEYLSQMALTDPGVPQASVATLAGPPVIWPENATPAVKIISVGPASVSNYPLADMIEEPDVRITPDQAQNLTVTIAAQFVPLDWTVSVRLVPTSGADSVVNATFQSGDATASVWTAQLSLNDGFSALQAAAVAP